MAGMNRVIEVEPTDDLTPMDQGALQKELFTLRDRHYDLKSKRNYTQMERDMIEQFYKNTLLGNPNVNFQVTTNRGRRNQEQNYFKRIGNAKNGGGPSSGGQSLFAKSETFGFRPGA
jgi:hypothetical protein